MQRLLSALLSAVTALGVVFVLPVAADAQPDPAPVESSITEIPLGSVTRPAPEADVEPGLTESVPGLESVPVLRLRAVSTDLFTTAGVTWALDAEVTDVLIRLRVRDAAGTWGSWTDLEISAVDAANPHAANAGELRGGTEPVWTNDSYGAQVELLTRSGHAPSDGRLVMIDPRRSAADSIPQATTGLDTANADAWQPPIYSRAQWGADENIRSWDPEYASTLRAGTVHHTADSNDYDEAEVPQILRSIYSYHSLSRGWGDIGYNFVVDKFGRIWEGRYGGIASTVIGAHAGGFNTYTVGVSMLGNYDLIQPPMVLLDGVAQVLAWKFSIYGLSPYGSTTLVSGGGGTSRYSAGTAVNLPAIFGHRDVGSTTCPGKYGYSWMQWFRERVAQLQGAGPNALLTLPRNDASPGPALGTVAYGGPYATMLSCDFDGNGNDEIAVFERGYWAIRHSWSAGPAEVFFSYGDVTWQPVCGDWNGDGIDGIGVFDGTNWYLRDTATAGPPTVPTFAYGWPGTFAVVGDWDQDGKDTIGTWIASTGEWLLRNANTGGAPSLTFAYGFSGALPVPADFNGDGRTDAGIFFAGSWYLRMSPTPGPAERLFAYGGPGYRPVVGNFDGLGGASIAVSVPGRI